VDDFVRPLGATIRVVEQLGGLCYLRLMGKLGGIAASFVQDALRTSGAAAQASGKPAY